MTKFVLIALLSSMPAMSMAQEKPPLEAVPADLDKYSIEGITIDTGVYNSRFFIVHDKENGNVCYLIPGSYGVNISCLPNKTQSE